MKNRFIEWGVCENGTCCGNLETSIPLQVVEGTGGLTPPVWESVIAHKRDIPKIQSEYGYNYDGELDPPELIIAFEK